VAKGARLSQTDPTQDAMPWRRMLDTTPVIET
jgi:hypothetical protein